jgi:hypothetical protein
MSNKLDANSASGDRCSFTYGSAATGCIAEKQHKILVA